MFLGYSVDLRCGFADGFVLDCEFWCFAEVICLLFVCLLCLRLICLGYCVGWFADCLWLYQCYVCVCLFVLVVVV